MSVFTDNFSTHSTSEVANATTPTGITGWTGAFNGPATHQNVTIVTDGGALGGKVMRITDTGWGNNIFIGPTTPGSIANGTETEILVSWRVNNTTTNRTDWGRMNVPVARSTTNLSQRYAVGFHKTASAIESQLWELRAADDWANVDNAFTLTGFAAGDWWWTRLKVTAAGAWQWKSWKHGDAEPAYFISATSATAVTGGWCGLGAYNIEYQPIDIQHFSVGTGGDPPDDPGGGPPPTPKGRRLGLLGVGR